MKSQLSFSAIISLILVLANQINADFVDTTCKGTPNYRLCIAILRKDKSSSTADLTGLALIMTRALELQTSVTLSKIKVLLRQMPKLKGPLSQCDYDYGTVLNDDIPETYEALHKGNAKFAESGVADAAIEAESCEDYFKGLKSPLTHENKLQDEIANVARQIIRKLL